MRNRIGLFFDVITILSLIFLLIACCSGKNGKGNDPNAGKNPQLKVIDPSKVDTSYAFNIHEFAIIKNAREHPDEIRDCLYVFEATKRAANLFDFKGVTRKRLIALLGSPDSSEMMKKEPKCTEKLEFGVINFNTKYCRQCTFVITLTDSRVTGMKFRISDW